MKNQILDEFFTEIIKVKLFIEANKAGYEHHRSGPSMMETLKYAAEVLNDEELIKEYSLDEENVKRMERISEEAKKEIENDFPFSCGLATTRLWSILEAMVDEMVLDYLKDKNRVSSNQELNDLKITLSIKELPMIESDEWPNFILNKFKQDYKTVFGDGVGQIKPLLKLIEVYFGFPEVIDKAILELQQVRHLIIHKNSKVDSRFLKKCPWFKEKISERITINSEKVRGYWNLTFWFLLEMEKSLLLRDNPNIFTDHPELLEDFKRYDIQCLGEIEKIFTN